MLGPPGSRVLPNKWLVLSALTVLISCLRESKLNPGSASLLSQVDSLKLTVTICLALCTDICHCFIQRSVHWVLCPHKKLCAVLHPFNRWETEDEEEGDSLNQWLRWGLNNLALYRSCLVWWSEQKKAYVESLMCHAESDLGWFQTVPSILFGDARTELETFSIQSICSSPELLWPFLCSCVLFP